MNKLILVAETGEVFGPFAAVERGEDRWLADGQHLPFAVVGEGAVVQPQGGWVPPAPPVDPEQAREAFKQARAEAVAKIKVTTSAGHEFDGDETSQGRMARALTALQYAPAGTTLPWVLADNTVIEVGIAELAEALILSGQEQADLWVAP